MVDSTEAIEQVARGIVEIYDYNPDSPGYDACLEGAKIEAKAAIEAYKETEEYRHSCLPPFDQELEEFSKFAKKWREENKASGNQPIGNNKLVKVWRESKANSIENKLKKTIKALNKIEDGREVEPWIRDIIEQALKED